MIKDYSLPNTKVNFFHAYQELNLSILRSASEGDNKLNAMLNDFRHSLNDQLIELKYGKGYKLQFLDSILIQAQNL